MEELLDSVVTDDDVDVIAEKYLTDWETLCSRLKLSRAKEREIRKTWQEYGCQKREFLHAWKKEAGPGATYRVFIEAAIKARNKKLADDVRAMLRDRIRAGLVGKTLGMVAVSTWCHKRGFLYHFSSKLE